MAHEQAMLLLSGVLILAEYYVIAMVTGSKRGQVFNAEFM